MEYREAVRLAPEGADSAMAHCRLGEALIAQGRYSDAELANRNAIRADPCLAAAHTGLGWALRQLGARAEAEHEFRTGIALDASGTEGHLGLGTLLQDAMQYPAAEAEFREAIRLDRSSGTAHRALGRLLASTGRHPEAEVEFRAAIGLQPGGDTGAEEDLAALDREIGDPIKIWGRWAAALRQRGRQRLALASPAVLLRSPRARPLRRILAGLVDIVFIPMIALAITAQFSLWAMATAAAVSYALNGYLEGCNGQSVGKMLGGLHTIHRATGERIGGGKGVLRRLLHALDYPYFVGFVVGLASGRTFADRIMGTRVVWNPAWVTTTCAPEIAALELKDYMNLTRKVCRMLLISWLLYALMADVTDPDKPGRHTPRIILGLWNLLFGSDWRRPASDEEEEYA